MTFKEFHDAAEALAVEYETRDSAKPAYVYASVAVHHHRGTSGDMTVSHGLQYGNVTGVWTGYSAEEALSKMRGALLPQEHEIDSIGEMPTTTEAE